MEEYVPKPKNRAWHTLKTLAIGWCLVTYLLAVFVVDKGILGPAKTPEAVLKMWLPALVLFIIGLSLRR